MLHFGGIPFSYTVISEPDDTNRGEQIYHDPGDGKIRSPPALTNHNRVEERCRHILRCRTDVVRPIMQSYRRGASIPQRDKDCQRLPSMTFATGRLTEKLPIEAPEKVVCLHPEVLPQDQRMKLTQRSEVVAEILETERNYVDALVMIHNMVIEPIVRSFHTDDPILSRLLMGTIFSNFEDILQINSTLLMFLENRLTRKDPFLESPCDCIGDIFQQLGHFLKMYSLYCRNFTDAVYTLQLQLRDNKMFVHFLQSAELKEVLQNLKLQDYLLMPVQRIPRYRLLLSTLLRCTEDLHPDFTALSNAYSIIDQVATSINESIRCHENKIEMLLLQRSFVGLDHSLLSNPSRKLLKRGSLWKANGRKPHVVEVFLFSDCLMYAILAVPSEFLDVSYNFYIFKRRIALDDLEMAWTANEHFEHGIQIMSSEESLVVSCSTAADVTKWWFAIEQARHTFVSDKASLKLCVGGDSSYPIAYDYQAPIWVADADVHACVQCQAMFTLWRGRHHCRLCGMIICSACSTKRFLASSESETALRICNICYSRRFDKCGEGAHCQPSIRSYSSTELLSTRLKRSLAPGKGLPVASITN